MELATENKKTTGTRVELLAPAGNYEAFLGAVNAGADAVYLGGEKFGARAYADNFTTEEICRAIHTAHFMGRKIYLTVNTLIKESEFGELIPYLQPFYEAGLDGVIVQDIGVLMQIRAHFPGLALHASTQMTLTGPAGCSFLQEQGVERVVPARELSLAEVQRIKEQTGLEIECFVHGAMCYCYSGQCLFSSVLGGRSGNRGRCAQSCRLPYRICDDMGKKAASDIEYPLSLKDLCTISHLPRLIEAGIDSFKIEGRMKRAEYAAGVTALYRKYIDLYYQKGRAAYQVSKEDMDRLRSLYIRSEIQTGYYERHNGREMITLHKPGYAGSDERLLTRIRERYLHDPDRAAVSMTVTLEEGRPARLQITGSIPSDTRKRPENTGKNTAGTHSTEEGGREQMRVLVEGAIVETARKAPLQAEDVRKRFLKTGNSCLSVRECEIVMPGEVFLPVGALNELRRAGIEAYERQCILQRGMTAGRNMNWHIPTESVNRTGLVDEKSGNTLAAASVDILISTCEQFAQALRFPCRRIYIDSDLYLEQHARIVECIAEHKTKGLSAEADYYLALPYILRADDDTYMERLTALLSKETGCPAGRGYECRICGFLVRNYEEAAFLQNLPGNYDMVPDAGLYCFNAESVRFWAHYCKEYTLPWELNRKEAENLAGHAAQIGMRTAMIVYGRIPMMVTANCIRRTAGQCQGAQRAKESASGSRFQLKDRYGVIFPVEINCRHCYNIIYNSVPFSLHQQEQVLEKIGADVRRYDFTTETAGECRQILTDGKTRGGSYTTGHLKRGVE